MWLDGAVSERLQRAFAEVDEINRRDPSRVDGEPAELVYGRRMTAWLERLAPDAGEALRLAVRAQHVGRFELPRAEFPDGRAGYKRWRTELAKRHAATAAAIATRVGYEPAIAARVADLVTKKRLTTDPETQLLEDVACLVFLEHYFVDFARKHERAKLVDIVRKTWAKMSPRGHAAALGLPLGAAESAIVVEAIGAAGAAGGST
jgi:hypothetical protein